ncbi:MAG: polysaccharide biosynthesis protein [Lachnospiraceae bacterium]|nr:polysaccharide biosynthesis protein [Lachnospiraceae bacterium]
MRRKIHFVLIIYDMLAYIISASFILYIYPSSNVKLSMMQIFSYTCSSVACLLACRLIFGVYEQIWRYAGPGEYMRLIVSDACATVLFIAMRAIITRHLLFLMAVVLFLVALLESVSMRLIYQWLYLNRNRSGIIEKIGLFLIKILINVDFSGEDKAPNRIRIAIIGAGSVGAALAEELKHNTKSVYVPVCFVDIDKGKSGREIYNIPVINPESELKAYLEELKVQEVVFALPNVTSERRTELYEFYSGMGYKIKVYDYPVLSVNNGGKRQLHDFNIEDLLFRPGNDFLSEESKRRYAGKSILITGGGGSIGSELARQIATCGPSRLVILDVYENGAYDVQQELIIRHGDSLNLRIEIASVCDAEQIDKIFREHTPDIVFHAAAHKHVPLMERNVLEAVRNNVFGTLNVVEACERHGVDRFIMISTDKAVNPTNVMGATKRLCEMIVQSRTGSRTSFSATRFGNVLGSNGSVIPLFKKQIAEGGPVTVTDKRIIRYFMTIPEAAQLVMTNAVTAKNGELYVLDMGKPVKILDLAENMIRLSGLEPYRDIDIIETGLRPGEKLYEELLIKTEELDKTENEMIFVERDRPLEREKIQEILDKIEKAMESQSNRVVKRALMDCIPTYHTPDEVNEKAISSEEMRLAASV